MNPTSWYIPQKQSKLNKYFEICCRIYNEFFASVVHRIIHFNEMTDLDARARMTMINLISVCYVLSAICYHPDFFQSFTFLTLIWLCTKGFLVMVLYEFICNLYPPFYRLIHITYGLINLYLIKIFVCANVYL
jgi:hypothetical protein